MGPISFIFNDKNRIEAVIDKFDNINENNKDVRSDFYVMLLEYLEEGDYKTDFKIPEDMKG